MKKKNKIDSVLTLYGYKPGMDRDVAIKKVLSDLINLCEFEKRPILNLFNEALEGLGIPICKRCKFLMRKGTEIREYFKDCVLVKTVHNCWKCPKCEHSILRQGYLHSEK